MKNGRMTEVRWVWVRIAIMCASLAGVSYTIWNLARAKDPRPELNFCPTRITSLELKGAQRLKIQQEGPKWLGTRQTTNSDLPTLAVEKWLGQYCFFRAEKILESEHVPTSATEVLALSYIDGTKDQVLSLDGELFYWKGALYRTKEWQSLLRDLKALVP